MFRLLFSSHGYVGRLPFLLALFLLPFALMLLLAALLFVVVAPLVDSVVEGIHIPFALGIIGLIFGSQYCLAFKRLRDVFFHSRIRAGHVIIFQILSWLTGGVPAIILGLLPGQLYFESHPDSRTDSIAQFGRYFFPPLEGPGTRREA